MLTCHIYMIEACCHFHVSIFLAGFHTFLFRSESEQCFPILCGTVNHDTVLISLVNIRRRCAHDHLIIVFLFIIALIVVLQEILALIANLKARTVTIACQYLVLYLLCLNWWGYLIHRTYYVQCSHRIVLFVLVVWALESIIMFYWGSSLIEWYLNECDWVFESYILRTIQWQSSRCLSSTSTKAWIQRFKSFLLE
jgi:hypothetical protein